MDTKTLINNLRTLFCNENKIQKQITKVWLNKIYALGFHDTKTFELNVQYDHPISNADEEWIRIINLVSEKIKMAWRIGKVDLHYFDDDYRRCNCDCEDILVYDVEKDTA